MHCLLLVGYDDSGYYFNDSLQCKNMRYDKSKVISAYNALNCQAVVIAPKSASDEPPSSAKPETTTSPATTKPQNTTEPVSRNKAGHNGQSRHDIGHNRCGKRYRVSLKE